MNYQKRVLLLYVSLLFCAFVLSARLYNLSQEDTNPSLTVLDGQYTGRIDIAQRSGFVYDRNLRLLSHEKEGYVALVNPSECDDYEMCAENLSKQSRVSTKEDILKKLSEGTPFTLLMKKQTESVPENVYLFPIYAENNDVAIHLLGYNDKDGNGVCGIRKVYSSLLNEDLFAKAFGLFERNAKNKSTSSLVVKSEKYDSRDGIITTLDKDLQKFCDSLEKDVKSGAVLIADVGSGQILASSSFPSYDKYKIADILDSDKGELVNRVTSSYAPGSVFKTVVAVAALEKDESLWEEKYVCTGEIEVDGTIFHCHNRSGHGEVSMKEAFAQSCNTYFINLGQKMGLCEIIKTMEKIGLDEKSAADFLCEETNYFPDIQNTSLGYLANISIGQGDLCLSTLDMTKVVISAITGKKTSLSLILGQISGNKEYYESSAENERIFSESTCKKMLTMMNLCVNEGTGRKAKGEVASRAGKTATAQTGRKNEVGVEYVHKWFCGTDNAENPKFSICIIFDYSTESGLSPAVVFGKICDYLEKREE